MNKHNQWKTLCVNPVHIKRLSQHVDGEVVELVDDTGSLFHILLLCLHLPPVHQSSSAIVLAAPVVEA